MCGAWNHHLTSASQELCTGLHYNVFPSYQGCTRGWSWKIPQQERHDSANCLHVKSPSSSNSPWTSRCPQMLWDQPSPERRPGVRKWWAVLQQSPGPSVSPVATSLWPPSSRCGSPAAATKSQLGSSRGAWTGFWKQETRIGNILWHQFLCKKLLWGCLRVAHLLLEQSMPWLCFQQSMDWTPWFSLPVSALSGCLRMLICSWGWHYQ